MQLLALLGLLLTMRARLSPEFVADGQRCAADLPFKVTGVLKPTPFVPVRKGLSVCFSYPKFLQLLMILSTVLK